METLTNGRVDPQPWHLIPDRMAELGLTDEDGMTKAWFVNGKGYLSGGAEAINESLRYCWWLRPLTYLYYIPGIRQLQDRIYQWVADNRYRMPGSTPSCAVEPVDGNQ